MSSTSLICIENERVEDSSQEEDDCQSSNLMKLLNAMSYRSIPEIINSEITIQNYVRYMLQFLKIPPPKRSELEIDILKKCTSFLRFFKERIDFDPNDNFKTHENGCRVLKYCKKRRGDILIKYGDQPNEFYVKLNGKIGVYIPRHPDDIKKEIKVIKWLLTQVEENKGGRTWNNVLKKRNKSKMKKTLDNLPFFSYNEVNQHYVVYTDEKFKELSGGLGFSEIGQKIDLFDSARYGIFRFQLVSTLEDGQMFGELGLIYSRPRVATIMALSDSELAIMEKEDFLNIFKDIITQEENQKREFFEKKIIKKYYLTPLAGRFMLMFERVKHPKDSIIIREGDKIKDIMTIFEGKVAICKDWIPQAPDGFINSNTLQKPKELTRQKKHLFSLTRGEFIGDEYAFEKEGVFTYSVIALSDCQFFSISRDKFANKFKENPELIFFIRERLSSKRLMLKKMEEKFESIKYEQRNILSLKCDEKVNDQQSKNLNSKTNNLISYHSMRHKRIGGDLKLSSSIKQRKIKEQNPDFRSGHLSPKEINIMGDYLSKAKFKYQKQPNQVNNTISSFKRFEELGHSSFYKNIIEGSAKRVTYNSKQPTPKISYDLKQSKKHLISLFPTKDCVMVNCNKTSHRKSESLPEFTPISPFNIRSINMADESIVSGK